MDTWVLALTATTKEAQEIKQKIVEYLKTKKKMDLDVEKTKITQVSKGYKFIGFENRLNIKPPRLKRVLQKSKSGVYSRALKRTTSRKITIEPDTERIFKRLKLLKFCDITGKAKGILKWHVYDEFK